MSIPGESRRRESSAPNAILEHMRRRIAHIGLLVAAVSALLTSLAILIVCALVRWR
jgi:hypothetical protein